MDLSKFLTYWSLTFAIVFIWIFSIAVALADVKDDFMDKLKKQGAAAARSRPADPLAGRSVAETLRPPAMTKNQAWVFELVKQVATFLNLDVKIIVLQDSMDHYLVHFTRGKQLVSYRVDKAWVTDAMGGTAEQREVQRERIRTAVEQYLRQEFLGEKMTPKAPAAPAKAPTGSGPTGARPAASPGAAQAAPSGSPSSSPPPGPSDAAGPPS